MKRHAGLHLIRSSELRLLAAHFTDSLGDLSDDPFVTPTVIVPNNGVQRWLSQHIAGTNSVCAGLSFVRMTALFETLSGSDTPDSWRAPAIAGRIMALVDAQVPGLEPLAQALNANDQRFANAHRIARLLLRYARFRPEMLHAWSAASDVASLGLGFASWQAVLWRHLCEVTPAIDPAAAWLEMVERLRSDPAAWASGPVSVFAPRSMSRCDADLLAALATHHPVTVWLNTIPDNGRHHPLSARLGSRNIEMVDLLTERATSVREIEAPQRPATLLGAVQNSVLGSPSTTTITPDVSIDIHSSYGLGRQAEVLRETLTGLFQDNPDLEPRDVVVLCPAPEALAPHLNAAFGGPASSHPARWLRVRWPGAVVSEPNSLFSLASDVLTLPSQRATVSEVLSLAGHPFVARRFGFSLADLERLEELIELARVRWGLSPAHRAEYGLGNTAQNTWQTGIQRLLLGEALDGTAATIGHIAPVDDVDSSDVALLGRFAEFLSRVNQSARSSLTAPEWLSLVRDVIGSLADVPHEQSWQATQFESVLARLERQTTDVASPVSRSDVLAMVQSEFRTISRRPVFGTGDLLVCGMNDLAHVPHRVICLVGLDEGSFPRRAEHDGDNLMVHDPAPGDPDRARDDRQSILNAIMAAQNRLIVVYQGLSSHAIEARPAPSGITDLIQTVCALTGDEAAAERLITKEPLQPFSPLLFTEPARSFDAAGLAAARSLTQAVRSEQVDPFAVGTIPLEEKPDVLQLNDIIDFMAHPAKFFLKRRASLTLYEEDEALDQLPIAMDPLSRWACGNRIVTSLMSSLSPDQAKHLEWLQGDLPPGELGYHELEMVTRSAVATVTNVREYLSAPATWHTIDIEAAGIRLQGRAKEHGDLHVSAVYSKSSSKPLITAWVEMLALTVALGRPVGGVISRQGKCTELIAPSPGLAQHYLGQLAHLTVEGMERILPVPPNTAQRWLEHRKRQADPAEGLGFTWRYENDVVWKSVLGGRDPWQALCTTERWAVAGEPTLLGSLASIIWAPVGEATR